MAWLLTLFVIPSHWTRADGASADRAALRTDDDACVRAATTRVAGRSPDVDWSAWDTCMAARGWVWVPTPKDAGSVIAAR